MIITLEQLSLQATAKITTTTTSSTTLTTTAASAKTKMEQNIELTTRSVLLRALIEKRIICGFPAAINTLSQSTEDSIFCFLAQPKKEDSATNMSHTLLEAFCYENDIYVIKVDCAEKLSRILGQSPQTTCVLIQKTWDKRSDDPVEVLTPDEHTLVDYCELNWDTPNQMLKLPG